MNNEQLTALVRQLSLTFFATSFSHQAYFNPRLRTTGGRYMLATHHIEVNPKVYENYGEEELSNVIKHELCHYHLHLANLGYQHRDADFKQLAKRVGAPRFCQPLAPRKYPHKYQCERCATSYQRQRKIDTTRYRCGRCKGKINKIE